MRKAISTEKAPSAIGPYSQAVRAGDFLYVSGQVPFDPATMTLVEGDIQTQTRRVMENLGAILAAADATWDQVVKTTIFLKDMNDFAAVNEVYGSYFSAPAPARATVQAARLPKDVGVEIELVAFTG